MVKMLVVCILLLNLVSCQKSQVVRERRLAPDRGQLLLAADSKKLPGVITGQVLDLRDDSAIAGALVTIRKGKQVITTTMTDSHGFFKVIGLPQNSYHVTAEKNDFSTLSFSSVSLEAGKEVVTHFILSPITRIEYVKISQVHIEADSLSKDS
jgi:hypothetical protein